ncbi:hypothetical protein [Geodermatophilus normandii]|uniref:Uncharacterized protein n=1 Tax=Geodermatophilus normandii TaxID=1137989 RepID=A0A6P0GLA8_9ACTN|nr:hypothetical protein [Geodermatophilus normandii]NEM08046.1 hypothetical protein [Geodermatophilus normandii]
MVPINWAYSALMNRDVGREALRRGPRNDVLGVKGDERDRVGLRSPYIITCEMSGSVVLAGLDQKRAASWRPDDNGRARYVPVLRARSGHRRQPGVSATPPLSCEND